jgi:hypothetical protein
MKLVPQIKDRQNDSSQIDDPLNKPPHVGQGGDLTITHHLFYLEDLNAVYLLTE